MTSADTIRLRHMREPLHPPWKWPPGANGLISRRTRTLLGVTRTAHSRNAFLAAYRRVRYCFHLTCSAADPSPLPKNRCLTPAGLTAASREMTPGEAKAARNRPEIFINALVEASVSGLGPAERAAFGGGNRPGRNHVA